MFLENLLGRTETRCSICGKTSPLITSTLAVCADCIRARPSEALPLIMPVHAETRRKFYLPVEPPRAADGVHCPICTNECVIGEGEYGFCGLRTNESGRLVHLAGKPSAGLLSWYYDPLPTNCVADWVCEGHHQRGYKNLAVFYEACSFNLSFAHFLHRNLSFAHFLHRK
ncbi:MAG: hypothetical protein H5T62_17220 [Anaerolineae bacterium]|nr:hypothetical protein [Anaerolineae bacterium]